jgi:hypothetical protein
MSRTTIAPVAPDAIGQWGRRWGTRSCPSAGAASSLLVRPSRAPALSPGPGAGSPIGTYRGWRGPVACTLAAHANSPTASHDQVAEPRRTAGLSAAR